MKVTTKDLGLAIRDFIEEHKFCAFEEVNGEINPTKDWQKIQFVDCGDPSNLLVHLENGQRFRVRIFAEG
jgi:hypothetical protein